MHCGLLSYLCDSSSEQTKKCIFCFQHFRCYMKNISSCSKKKLQKHTVGKCVMSAIKIFQIWLNEKGFYESRAVLEYHEAFSLFALFFSAQSPGRSNFEVFSWDKIETNHSTNRLDLIKRERISCKAPSYLRNKGHKKQNNTSGARNTREELGKTKRSALTTAQKGKQTQQWYLVVGACRSWERCGWRWRCSRSFPWERSRSAGCASPRRPRRSLGIRRSHCGPSAAPGRARPKDSWIAWVETEPVLPGRTKGPVVLGGETGRNTIFTCLLAACAKGKCLSTFSCTRVTDSRQSPACESFGAEQGWRQRSGRGWERRRAGQVPSGEAGRAPVLCLVLRPGWSRACGLQGLSLRPFPPSAGSAAVPERSAAPSAEKAQTSLQVSSPRVVAPCELAPGATAPSWTPLVSSPTAALGALAEHRPSVRPCCEALRAETSRLLCSSSHLMLLAMPELMIQDD